MPKVLYSALEDAFDFSGGEHQYWLDKQTGEVIAFDEETARQLAAGDDLANALEWQRGMIEGARRVLQAYGELPDIEADEAGDSDRYVQCAQARRMSRIRSAPGTARMALRRPPVTALIVRAASASTSAHCCSPTCASRKRSAPFRHSKRCSPGVARKNSWPSSAR